MTIADYFFILCKIGLFSPSMQKLQAQNRGGFLKPFINTEAPPVLGGSMKGFRSGGIRPSNVTPKVTQSFAPKPINT